MEGDVECWRSSDGEFWERAGVAAPHEPQTVRMNHAAGLTRNGDLLVLCSGWSHVAPTKGPKPLREVLLPWICRSSDQARTWKRHGDFPAPPAEGWTPFIPFGPVVSGEDGKLHVSAYSGSPGEQGARTGDQDLRIWQAWQFRSDDGGTSWRAIGKIGPEHNETGILHLGGKRWLAAARKNAVDLFRSDDDGVTWQGPQQVTREKEVNATLLRLSDTRLLLSYGCRVRGEQGVLAKLSADDGVTWSDPIRLSRSLGGDCGYPSSIQRADGRIVTAFYTGRAENHERYHMGVAIWEVPAKQ
jgi:hypothetical protein